MNAMNPEFVAQMRERMSASGNYIILQNLF
jgi:hypothetical protein